ncbi:hypothetical protein MMC11_004782 [Xylographa trunciseda]|nr:hypothetical protein [Xylographa trunciseda]
MGNDLSTLNNKFGLLAGLLGNISATTCGLSAKRTVAMHCRGGWTWNNLFVIDGPLEPEDRYEGMKVAFGAETEILKPYREGPGLSHDGLDAAAYNKLMVTAQNRGRSWDAYKDKSRVTNDAVRYHRPNPIWGWAVQQKYGLLVAGLYALPALGALPLLFAIKAWYGDARPMMVYLVLFAIVKVYTQLVLYTDRHVCYIQIAEEAAQVAETEPGTAGNQFNDSGSTSRPSGKSPWRTLRDRQDITTLPPIDGASVDDVRQGRVRLLTKDGKEYLLVPVIALQPLVGFDKAQWVFIARRFRGPLLTISWFAEGSLNHTWSVAFAICAFVAAALQDDVARVFLVDTKTYSVNWLRLLDNHDYPEEYVPFRQPLAWNFPSVPKPWPWLWPTS